MKKENKHKEQMNKFKNYECDGILVDEKTLDDAHIDHQTLNDYTSLYDFSENGIDYVTFVFNRYVMLQTDCD